MSIIEIDKQVAVRCDVCYSVKRFDVTGWKYVMSAMFGKRDYCLSCFAKLTGREGGQVATK